MGPKTLKLFLVILIIAVMSVYVHADEKGEKMANNNYMCSKCGTMIQKSSVPSAAGCPSGGHHQWNNLGQEGNNSYQCKKCGKTVNSKNLPSAAGCPSGGHHQWNKL